MICRGHSAELQSLDLTSLVREMAPMLRLLLGEQITLRVDAGADAVDRSRRSGASRPRRS